MPDPIRILVEQAPRVEKCTAEVEKTIDVLYQAVSTLNEHWRTVIVNGEAIGVQRELTINVEKLPTWQSIQELLARWHALDADYRATWEQLSDEERERLSPLDPDSLTQV